MVQKSRSRSLAFEHGDLLAESEDFQGGIGSWEENAEHNQDSKEELQHELTVVTRRNARLGRPRGDPRKPLISRSGDVLSTHRWRN